MSSMIRLVVTDDHELVRSGLVQFLGAAPGIEVVAEASCGAELLEKLTAIRADLILLDLTMPGMSGEDLIAHIKNTYPAMQIMVLSMHSEPEVILGTIRAGASAYICKDRSPQDLLEAIRDTVSTAKYLDASVAERSAYAIAFKQVGYP